MTRKQSGCFFGTRCSWNSCDDRLQYIEPWIVWYHVSRKCCGFVDTYTQSVYLVYLSWFDRSYLFFFSLSNRVTDWTQYIDLTVRSRISAEIYEVVLVVPKRLTGTNCPRSHISQFQSPQDRRSMLCIFRRINVVFYYTLCVHCNAEFSI